MIESREQRRKTTLLHRRKVAIIVFALVFAALAITLSLLYHFFNTVFYFRDYDNTIYYVKRIDGVFGMYDKEGNELKKDVPLGTTDELYITPYNTWVQVDPKTGDTVIRGIPDLHYAEDGEGVTGDTLIVIEYIDESEIEEVSVTNTYGKYSIVSIDREGNGESYYFIMKEAPFISVDDDVVRYLTYYAGHIQANKRLEAEKDEDGNVIYDPIENLSDYGLAEEIRFDEEGNPYNYVPSSYVITTKSGEKHTITIGDRLLDGSGYYLQYKNPEGTVRPAVYVLHPADVSAVDEKMTYETTFLGPAKNYLIPSMAYDHNESNYNQVENYSITQKGNEAPLIDFSFVDLADRTGTVLGMHPYVFNATSFNKYNPNHDNIDTMLIKLATPTIKDIAVINPTDAQKAEYGLMSLRVDENGNPILDQKGNKQYYYDAEYVIKFDRKVTDEETGKDFKVTQRIYISKMNENGNYYTYTVISMPPDTTGVEGANIKLNIINEVSESTLSFLKWDSYDWVYPTFLQMDITYTTDVEATYGDYSVHFKINNGKVNNLTTTGIDATDSNGRDVSTFSVLEFTDREGYRWIVTPREIYVYNANGNEAKPASLRSEDNSINERVHVIDGYRTAANGDKVYIDKDYVTIVRANGKTDKLLRYHTSIFRKLFLSIISLRIVDSHAISPEEEAALIANKENHILTIKTTDENGKIKTCDFYKITERKAYIVVDGQGGFYLQTKTLQKFINDVEKFFAGQDIDNDAIK